MTSALIAAICLASPGPPTGSPYDVDFVADGAVTVALFGVLGLLDGAVAPTLNGGITCAERLANGRCDPKSLSSLDRSMIDNDSQTWADVSDLGGTVSSVLPLVANALDVALSQSSTKLVDYAADATVMLESVGLAMLVTNVTKYAVRRPRPTQYREGAYVSSVQHQLSFPSGHTTGAAAATVSYAVTFTLRHPDSPWRYAVDLGAAALTGLTAYGRVGGGWHFYSDVAAGALIGTAAGLLVPSLHRRDIELGVETVATREGEQPLLVARTTW